jgi:2-polyprenyl-3-methyl-5-hydroxy-6-metoxy-1,4-benzoquinol methylase
MTDDGFVCPVCGAQRAATERVLRDLFAPSGRQGRYPLARCAGCGLLRLHPQPAAATLAAAYSATYAPHTRGGLSGRAKGWLERRAVRRLPDLFHAPRRVLDVGCARGDLLLAIRESGNARVAGVELAAQAADEARQRGLDVRTGTLEEAGFPDDSFDTVVLSHVLEHVADPLETLREVRRVLAPGGAVVLWLPNAASVEARVLRGYWIGYDAPRHLTTFSVATLASTLERAGFRVRSVRHEAIGLEWAWALRLWLRERWPATELLLARLHPVSIVLGIPLAVVGALTRRSGRVQVVAEPLAEG